PRRARRPLARPTFVAAWVVPFTAKMRKWSQHLPVSVRSPDADTSHTGRSLHSASEPLRERALACAAGLRSGRAQIGPPRKEIPAAPFALPLTKERTKGTTGFFDHDRRGGLRRRACG